MVAVKYPASDSPATENFAYGEEVPTPTLPPLLTVSKVEEAAEPTTLKMLPVPEVPSSQMVSAPVAVVVPTDKRPAKYEVRELEVAKREPTYNGWVDVGAIVVPSTQ